MSTPMGPYGQDCPEASARVSHRWEEQIMTLSTNNNLITRAFPPSRGPACIISFHPHNFLLQGYSSYSHSHS